MDVISGIARPLGQRSALWLALGLFAAELLVLGILFKHGIRFDCADNWPQWTCDMANGVLVTAYGIYGALFLFAMRRESLRHLMAETGTRNWPLGVNALGFGIALLPVLWLTNGIGGAAIQLSFVCWVLGMALMLTGLALYLAPRALWGQFLAQEWMRLMTVAGVGALTPQLALSLQPIWRLEIVASLTFDAVALAIAALGYDVISLPEERIIGTEAFAIDVAPACSGIEGIALVTLFVSIYLWLFRDQLRFPRALLLYPIGILASTLFNVVRITVLLAIGLEGNPELAVGGFHSHAGWMMFTLVALGIVILAQSVPALQREPVAAAKADAAPLLPFWRDPNMAAILPFAVFMLTAIPVAALSATPGVIYPLRVVIVGAVMLGFWRLYRALPWRADPAALGIGAAIAALWILVPVAPGEGTAPYGALTGLLLVGWFIMRGIGTIVLVPVLEELFFRQYLHRLISVGTGRAWLYFASVVTAALFAVLHDRWAEAFLAGLAFSWLVHRTGGKVTDAIVAHAVANALIFGVAVATGRLEMI